MDMYHIALTFCIALHGIRETRLYDLIKKWLVLSEYTHWQWNVNKIKQMMNIKNPDNKDLINVRQCSMK